MYQNMFATCTKIILKKRVSFQFFYCKVFKIITKFIKIKKIIKKKMLKSSPRSVGSNKTKRTIESSQTNNPSAQVIFDDIVQLSKSELLTTSIENVLSGKFPGMTIIGWCYFKIDGVYYSFTYDIYCKANVGIVPYFQNHQQVMIIEKRSENPNFNAEIDTKIVPEDFSSLFIPIVKKSGPPIIIIEISKPPTMPAFSRQDFMFAQQLFKKFSIYSNFLDSTDSATQLAMKVSVNDQFPQVVGKINNALEKHFKCRKADIWMNNTKKRLLFCFDPDKETPILVEPSHAGVIGYCLTKCAPVHERSARSHPNYNSLHDGYYDEPVLAIPYVDIENRCWAVILRGRANPRYFTDNDISDLRTALPFVIQNLSASMSPPQFEAQLDDFEQRLTALLEVAEILSGTLDIDVLIPTIMERACQLLKSERCSLFLVDQAKQELVTRFHGGLDSEIRMPMNRGIVGHCATTGETINIEDAYLDRRFDKTVDLKTGYRTKSILCVPIYNNRGEIAGVTEMINKFEGLTFDADDIKMLMAFNVFCGISLDNAKLYSASLDLTRQLRTFVDLSAALSHADKIRNVLNSILENVIKSMDATRATIFHIDSTTEKLTKLLNAGTECKYDTLFANITLEKMQTQTFTSDDIEEILKGKESGVTQSDSGDPISLQKSKQPSRQFRIANLITRNAAVNIQGGVAPVNTQETTIVSSLMLNSENVPIGVLEIETQGKVLNENIKLLDCFTVFAAISIERSQLMDIVKMGQGELEIKQMLEDEERQVCNQIPQKLIIQNETIYTLAFDAQMWDQQYINILFNLFYKFDLPQQFNITNEKLYRFLSEMRDTYKKVPYHNWRHAVDVTQFVSYELLLSGYDKILTKFEIFALLVSAVCHDANHDGFTNVYNVKAETPLGILYKNQSVMETHHCQVSIGIISKEECNIFAALSPEDERTMWSTFISLILSTDMAKHFEILKHFNGLFDSGEFSLDNHEHRVLLMQLFLKTADISNVSRPFEIANRWCDILCEEFFRQGDLEAAQGMEYTSDLNDKAHLDKPKSQIGFYTFVCLPLYQAVAKPCPALEANVKQVQSNLAIWKKNSEEKQKAEQS